MNLTITKQLYCVTAGSNQFYVILPEESMLVKGKAVCSANQGATKTIVIAKPSGSTILSGTIDGTAGTHVDLTTTTTAAYRQQKCEVISVIIDLTGGTVPCTVDLSMEIDPFERLIA
jgi:hypothetical protein